MNDDYAELERLLRVSTPGPWEWFERAGGMFEVRSTDSRYVCSTMAIYQGERSAKLIVEMRNALPKLLEEVGKADRVQQLEVMAEYLAGRCADLDYLLASYMDDDNYSKAEDYMRYAENYWNYVSKKEKNNG